MVVSGFTWVKRERSQGKKAESAGNASGHEDVSELVLLIWKSHRDGV